MPRVPELDLILDDRFEYQREDNGCIGLDSKCGSVHAQLPPADFLVWRGSGIPSI